MPPLRVEVVVVMVPLVLIVAGTVSCSGGSGAGAGGRVQMTAFSMRIIWLKVGRVCGSSTQHDCTMNTSSGGVSSGRGGRICFKGTQDQAQSQ